MLARRVCAGFLIAALVGCLGLGAGSKYYKKGEDAQKAGDLEEAYRQYQIALKAEPTNARYKQAVADLGKQLAAEHRAAARAKEKQQDWAGASSEWARAAELVPEEREYQVRRDLSGLKAKGLGPDEWYEALQGVAETYPGDEVVARSLEGARAQAYLYNVNLAKQFLTSGEGARAFTYFERAKAIDPTTPGLDQDAMARAEALSIAEQASAKLDSGDAVGAYELYQHAYDKVPLPEIKRDMAKAKAKASAILAKLETARQQAKRKRYAEALRTYGAILDMEGAPPFIEEEAAQVRHDLLSEMVADANAKAEKKQIRPAHKILIDALTYANLGRVERDTYKAAIDHARDGRPKNAIEVLDKVGLETTSPLYGAARTLAVAAAREHLANAERVSKKSAEKALAMLAEIEPFEAELDGIGMLRRQLRAGSFLELLDQALAEAKKGDAAESSALLLAALNSSQAPAAMRDPATEGCDALKDGRYGAAERAFDRALAAAPRSKMAQRGVEVARILRQSGERQALETLRSGRGDQERAIATLEDAVSVAPNAKSAKEAVELLLSRAKSAGSDAEAAKLIGWAGRLAGGSAKNAIDDGAAKLAASDHAGAEAAFASGKGNAVAAAGREVAKSRMLAALSSGAKAAAKGDEASARALAKLLEKDPSNAEAKAAVKALLDQAAAHASKNEDVEAARFLGLATIATNPAPGVKKEIDKGNSALAKGQMAVAERAYADALDIEPENRVAAAGYEIARQARVGMLSSAIADAKTSGNVARAAEALKKTLEVDPNGAEAKKAFAELIAEAKRQGEAGNDAQAAALLDAANVVSKPETAKKKIASAIALLGRGEHEQAIAAFEAITSDADSQVAEAGKEIASWRRRSVLLAEAKGLETGSDLSRGAAAVAALRALDPADVTAKRAIDAALARAENAAAGGDDKAAARELKAVATALGEEREAKNGIAKLEAGDHQEAEDLFSYSSQSALALAGKKIARGRRLGSLRAGLSGQGEEAARAIAALLKADPNNKDAKKAFDGLLEDAKKAAKNADDVIAADKIKMASIAANAPDDLSTAIDTAAAHLAAGRHAEAEKAFADASDLARDSKVVKVGLEVARQRRFAVEKEAKSALAKDGDPRPHAKVLQASLLVEPNSKTVSQALAELMQRARKSAKAGKDAETAQVLEALALLENKDSEVQVKLTEASGLYAKGSFSEAESMFSSADGTSGSKVADLGRELARGRRIALLEAEWTSAKSDKDVLRENGIVQQILEIDPNHREAKAAAKRLEKAVGSSRLEAARSNKELGKLGVAYVYLERALKLDEKDAAAKREMADVTAKLKERLDLILLVEPVTRKKEVGSTACLGFDEMLRDEIMTVSSKRTDLGGYVLSPSWTKAVEEKSDKAPEVSGSIAVEVTKCKTTPRDGHATFTWSLLVPRKGSPAAQGEVSAELPKGLIPRDEQDEAGNNAKRALADRATTAFLESLESERGAIELWLLTLAEHAMAEKDVALAADAYARLSIKAPRSIDPKRLAAVEDYLAKELR